MTPRPAPRAPYTGTPTFQHHAPNAALLIDFDNVTMGIRSDLGKELKALLNSEVIRGKVAVQRAYADWRRYPQYIVPLAESSIDLIFAPAYGSSKKNATDLRMAIDAIELVFTRPEIGTFILMTGDSDFSSCVLKLKEYGKYVIGVGMRESSSDLLIQNCDEYYSYHSLSGLTRTGEIEESQEDPWVLVKRAAQQMIANRDVLRTDRLKQVMLELNPSFDEKKIGYSKFSRFVQEAATKGLVRLRKAENGQYEIVPEGEEEAAAPAKPQREEPRRGRGRDEGRREGRREAPVRAEQVGDAVAEGDGKGEQPPELAEPVPLVELPDHPEPAVRPTPQLEEAYGLLQQAVRELSGASGRAVRDGDVKRKILAVAPDFDENALGFAKFTRFLRQAHDAEAIDLRRLNGGNYEVSLPSTGKRYAAPATSERATGPGGDRASRAPTRESSAPVDARREQRTSPEERPARTETREPERETAAPRAAAPPAAPAPAAPATPSPTRPSATAPPFLGAIRGRRPGRGVAPEGPPPLLPGQVIPVGRVAEAAPAPAPEQAQEPAAPVAEAAPAAAEPAPAPEEREGKARSRRGRRGRGKARAERPERSDETVAGEPESTPAAGAQEIPAAPSVEEPTVTEAAPQEEATAAAEIAPAPAAEKRARRGRGARGRRAATGEEQVSILPGQAVEPAREEPPAPEASAEPEPTAEPEPEPKPEPKRRGRGRARAKQAAEASEETQPTGFSATALGLPEGRDEIVSYIVGSYRGIGRRTAETLVDELGEAVFPTLEEDPDRVRALLGEGRARTILDQWGTDIQRRRAALERARQEQAKARPAAKKAAAKTRGGRGTRSRSKKAQSQAEE